MSEPTGDSVLPPVAGSSEVSRANIAELVPSTRKRVFQKFLLAALGSIPWVGGFLSTMASLGAESSDIKADDMRTQWLDEHHRKLALLTQTLNEVSARFDALGEQIDDRVQSEEYLTVVRRAFRIWDRADTDEKRRYVATLVSNAAGTKLCTDDVVRLFVDWLDLYHEAHFAVIRVIHQEPGATRFDIWMEIHGELAREDSPEADLFRFLIRDLSTGGVIRQVRETTVDGRFLRKHPRRSRGHASRTMESAFEDSKPYELTALGRQFVHYAMSEFVRRIDDGSGHAPPDTGTPADQGGEHA